MFHSPSITNLHVCLCISASIHPSSTTNCQADIRSKEEYTLDKCPMYVFTFLNVLHHSLLLLVFTTGLHVMVLMMHYTRFLQQHSVCFWAKCLMLVQWRYKSLFCLWLEEIIPKNVCLFVKHRHLLLAIPVWQSSSAAFSCKLMTCYWQLGDVWCLSFLPLDFNQSENPASDIHICLVFMVNATPFCPPFLWRLTLPNPP